MIDTHHVFVADAKPALALPAQHSAYVFGAASPLGEALLNQLLASTRYTRVYVSTTAALPGSVAHLVGVLASHAFERQDDAAGVDIVMVVSDAQDVMSRSTVYAQLAASDLPALLRQVSSALAPTSELRYCCVSPNQAVSQAAEYLASYSAQAACMVYGLADGTAGSARKQAYEFKPQADSWLDRLGAKVLNVLSGLMHGMLNPQSNVPLTSVKIAQRLAARFEALPRLAGSVSVLTIQDLASQ